MTTDVFISHSTKDKQIADAVCHHLEARGIRCWIAPRDVPHGLRWADVLNDAITSCKILVLIFSSGANDSDIVDREILLAVKRRVTIIPFRIEDVQPSKTLEFFISAHHWLDAITPPMAKHIATLADSIEGYLSGKHVATTKYDPLKEIESITERWIQSGYQYSLLEGINEQLKILIKHPNEDIAIDDKGMLLMLMMASVHHGGDWPSWVRRNQDNEQAVVQLIKTMNISYFRPRFRALYALQSFSTDRISKSKNEMTGEVDPSVMRLIETYVMSGTVAEYLLKVKHGTDEEMARKAAKVLEEITRYTDIAFTDKSSESMPEL